MEIWTNRHDEIIDLDSLDEQKVHKERNQFTTISTKKLTNDKSNKCHLRDAIEVEQVVVKPELVIFDEDDDDDDDDDDDYHEENENNQQNYVNYNHQMDIINDNTSNDEDDDDFISYEELKLQYEFEKLQKYKNGDNVDNRRGDDDDNVEDDDVILIESDENSLNEEDRYEYVDPNKPHTCRLCFKQVANRYNLKRHMMIHTGERPYGCDICVKRFREFSDLKKHRKVHSHDDGYICMVCFEDIPSVDDSTKCQSCLDKENANKQPTSSFNTLELPRIDGNKKAFICPICDRIFGSPHNLKRHIMIHTGEKPFKCDVCNRPFREMSTLKKHQLTHTHNLYSFNNSTDAGSLHKCSICEKKFMNSSNLTEHIQSAHTELRVNCATIEYHQCPDCDRHFRTKHHLQSHMLTHNS